MIQSATFRPKLKKSELVGQLLAIKNPARKKDQSALATTPWQKKQQYPRRNWLWKRLKLKSVQLRKEQKRVSAKTNLFRVG